jgi:acetyl-CoA carboxylase biotin carboxyl carrier protein
MATADFQLERIKELIAIMRESGVTELAVELPDFKISLKREGAEGEGVDALTAQHQTTAGTGAGESELLPVVAPMVGMFRAATDHSSKVSAGDLVSAGQVIGAIEVMKVPNDIRSPVTGRAREVLAEDGAAVEYGEALMLIEPASVMAGQGEGLEAEAI